MTATAEPVPITIGAFLAVAGEDYGRQAMGLLVDRVGVLRSEEALAAALEVVVTAGITAAAGYRDAGCSRHQVRAYLRSFKRGAHQRLDEARALLRAPSAGEA